MNDCLCVKSKEPVAGCLYFLGFTTRLKLPGVILETEGSIQKIQKGALFHYKKGTPNLTSHYVHNLFVIVLKSHQRQRQEVRPSFSHWKKTWGDNENP